MENVKVEKKGNSLVLTVDLSMKVGDSKSGKSVVIATTGGNVDVGDGIMVGLNVYKKK
jgi:hypothetical protein